MRTSVELTQGDATYRMNFCWTYRTRCHLQNENFCWTYRTRCHLQNENFCWTYRTRCHLQNEMPLTEWELPLLSWEENWPVRLDWILRICQGFRNCSFYCDPATRTRREIWTTGLLQYSTVQHSKLHRHIWEQWPYSVLFRHMESFICMGCATAELLDALCNQRDGRDVLPSWRQLT
jgi:hypothetical protein